MIRRIKNKVIRTIFKEQWSLLVCERDGKPLKQISPPKDRIWSDPFPVEHEGRFYIFLEEQIAGGNGTLGFIELYPGMEHSSFVPVLEKPYHLSYPQVFSAAGQGSSRWYMVPESHKNNTIDLYAAEEFPRRWVHETTLIKNITANDSTLLFYQGLWWIFTSTGNTMAEFNSNLLAFYSKSFPSNSWKAHPLNPLSSDSSNSRMAGSFFLEDGVLYRPAQDCRRNYGENIRINAVTSLSPETYAEKTVRIIRPEKNLHAVCTHTFNYCSSFLLRDIKTRYMRSFL
ncbi:MAG: hypothetical protein LBD31_09945 [Treponema sp.]|jgi:hypothetical protein|nr:hypothetical protein [Treponema sp.]